MHAVTCKYYNSLQWQTFAPAFVHPTDELCGPTMRCKGCCYLPNTQKRHIVYGPPETQREANKVSKYTKTISNNRHVHLKCSSCTLKNI